MKKFLKVFIITLAIGGLNTAITVHAAAYLPQTVARETTPSPRVDNFVWRYKIIDGKMYKRLYNEKSGEYIGDWILIA